MRSGPVESDCGCGPTPSELRALHGGVTRRTVVVAGALGALIAGFASGPGDPAFAAKYPTWDDVERARRNEASKNAEIARIETLIRSLQSDVEAKQAEAERLGVAELHEEFGSRTQDLGPRVRLGRLCLRADRRRRGGIAFAAHLEMKDSADAAPPFAAYRPLTRT